MLLLERAPRKTGGLMQFTHFTNDELETLAATLQKTITYAQQTLTEIEDRLWSDVCRNSPASLDQPQTMQQEK